MARSITCRLAPPPLPPDSATQCDGGVPANPVFQVGLGANTHNNFFGAFAPLNLVLADPVAFPGLPADTDGEIGLGIATTSSFPPTPSPSLTGTWQGSIDCAGVADFTDTETFSGPVVLKFGAQTGVSYGVELSDGSGNVLQTYCGDFANEIRVDSDKGAGQLFNNDPLAPEPVYLKAVNTDPPTLKARELLSLPDGSDVFDFSDGLNLCKWSFTQTNPAEPDPPIPAVCSSVGCGNGFLEPGELCDDGNSNEGDLCPNTCLACGNGDIDRTIGEECDDNNSVSGDGCSSTCKLENCGNGVLDPGEQCDDGNRTGGDGCSFICTIEE